MAGFLSLDLIPDINLRDSRWPARVRQERSNLSHPQSLTPCHQATRPTRPFTGSGRENLEGITRRDLVRIDEEAAGNVISAGTNRTGQLAWRASKHRTRRGQIELFTQQ